MLNERVYQWLKEKDDYVKIVLSIHQPLTTRQISKRTDIPTRNCSYIVSELAGAGMLICLNSIASSSRLYYLTQAGHQYSQKLHEENNLTYTKPVLPDIDWQLYGWVCFSHRSAIIKALTHPMQPSEVKRLFRLQGTLIRISANNIRDIIRLFLAKGIVRPVKIKKRAHLAYELTDLGIKFRQLLIKAEHVP